MAANARRLCCLSYRNADHHADISDAITRQKQFEPVTNKLWVNRWKQNDTGSHQLRINPLLRRFLPQLDPPANEKILVPLCAKSHDMDLMADDGYQVMGVELSKIAIQAHQRLSDK